MTGRLAVGKLYVVGTPIGNLEDITLRAVRVLGEVALIAAEDTRETRKLLQRYGIKTPLTSYFEHNKLAKLDYILGLLKDSDVALVSEAGMPGISDPGYELVRAAIEAGFPAVPIPGPSAAVTALAVSGLPTDQFVYVGFLPRRPGERRRALAELVTETRTVVAFEAPHRLLDTLAEIARTLGNRRIAVAHELTKLHEGFFRGTAEEAIAYLMAHPPRGEFTLVIGGAPEAPPATEDRLRQMLADLLAEGIASKEAVAMVAAESGRPRREVYRFLLGMRRYDNIDTT